MRKELIVNFLIKNNIEYEIMDEENEFIFFIKKDNEYGSDYDLKMLGKILEEWSYCFNEKPMTVNEIFLKGSKDLLNLITELCGELNGRAFGRWIKRNSNTNVYGLKFIQSNITRSSIAWKVVPQ